MRKIFKTAIAAVTTTAMVATMAAGVTFVNPTNVSAADNLIKGNWIHSHEPWDWIWSTNDDSKKVDANRGNTEYGYWNDGPVGNTTVTEDKNSFVADIAITGWQKMWNNQDTPIPDDGVLVGNGWCDNPFQLTSETEVNVSPMHTYELKFDIINAMTQSDGVTPTEKNVTVTVNSGIDGDNDNTLISKTVRVAKNGKLTFDEKFTLDENSSLDKVKIQIAYGAYAYSYDVNAQNMTRFVEDKYLFAKGTTENVNAKGKLTFENISLTETTYEGGNNNSGNNGSSNSGSNNNGSSNSGSNNNSGSNVNTGSSNKPNVSKPAQVKSVKVKNLKGKKAKISWAKVKTATKYQVKIGSKKYTSKKNTYTVKKGLKKKKTYKVYVRAYNKAGYGKWSKVKKVKITK